MTKPTLKERSQLLEQVRGVVEGMRNNWKTFDEKLPVEDLPPQIIEAYDDLLSELSKLEEGDV